MTLFSSIKKAEVYTFLHYTNKSKTTSLLNCFFEYRAHILFLTDVDVIHTPTHKLHFKHDAIKIKTYGNCVSMAMNTISNRGRMPLNTNKILWIYSDSQAPKNASQK